MRARFGPSTGRRGGPSHRNGEPEIGLIRPAASSARAALHVACESRHRDSRARLLVASSATPAASLPDGQHGGPVPGEGERRVIPAPANRSAISREGEGEGEGEGETLREKGGANRAKRGDLPQEIGLPHERGVPTRGGCNWRVGQRLRAGDSLFPIGFPRAVLCQTDRRTVFHEHPSVSIGISRETSLMAVCAES